MRHALSTRSFWVRCIVTGAIFGILGAVDGDGIAKAVAAGITFGLVFGLVLARWPSLLARRQTR